MFATQGETLSMIARLDQAFGTEKHGSVSAWWKDRLKTDDRSKRSTARARTLLETWSASGVNVYLLQNRENPVPAQASDKLLREAFAFVLDAGPFKPRDMIEHLRDTCPEVTKVRCTSFAKEVCTALETASILKKEKQGVLCL